MRVIKAFKYLTPIILLIVCFLLLFNSQELLNNKIIGMINQPGLQGEILLQKNITYNFEKGNLFKNFDTDFLNYPFGENLGFGIANSLHLLLYIPLKYLFGTIASYNILVILIFMLNFFSAYILAKNLFSSKVIALYSALLFTLNSYTLLKLNLGFLQKFSLFWIPLYCLALFKLQNTKKWRYALASVFFLSLMQLTYPPYAYYAIIFTAGLLLYLFIKHQEIKFAFSRFIFIITLFAASVSLIYYSIGFDFSYLKSIKTELDASFNGQLDIFSPFRFFPYHSPYYPNGLPLGISFSAFFLGAVALIKKKGLPKLLFFNLLLFTIIAAGPYLAHNGNLVQIMGHKVILPFYLISKYLPFAAGIFFPIRVFPFINICLAILAGYGLSYFCSTVKKNRSLLVISSFLAVYFLELLVFFPQLFPPKISDVHIPKFYQEIRNEDFEAILNLPISSDRKIINHYGYYAALCGKKIMNSYDKKALSFYMPGYSDSEKTKGKFIEQLSNWDVRYIVIHIDFLKSKANSTSSSDNYAWLKLFCDPGILYPEDRLLVYKIPLADKNKSGLNLIYAP